MSMLVQIEELKRFLPVAKNVIVDKCGGSCSVEQKKELQLLLDDIFEAEEIEDAKKEK